MLLIKTLGMGLVLSAGSLAAYSATHFEKRKLSVIDAWIDLILHIRAQIDCYLMPLDEILAGTDEEILKSCMCRTPHPDLFNLLEASSPYLIPQAKRLIAAFVKEIGGSYREEQLRRCDYYVNALRMLRQKIADDLPAKTKVCITFSLCLAIGVIILLW
jgi:hypothetical protein